MLDTFKTSTRNQFDAVFCTLHDCLERCPPAAWNQPIVNLKFCQVAFHTLFFADYYLGENESTLRSQLFHLEHPDFFRDYEELVDRPQQFEYDQPTTLHYLQHCRQKAAEVIARETSESLGAPCQFERRNFSRAELYIVNLRHIQHHSAHLSLRLQVDHAIDIPWVGSGWRAN